MIEIKKLKESIKYLYISGDNLIGMVPTEITNGLKHNTVFVEIVKKKKLSRAVVYIDKVVQGTIPVSEYNELRSEITGGSNE